VYSECTPVTAASFKEWKEKREAKKIQDALDRKKEEETKGKSKKTGGK
jgi:hypothetical protein